MGHPPKPMSSSLSHMPAGWLSSRNTLFDFELSEARESGFDGSLVWAVLHREGYLSGVTTNFIFDYNGDGARAVLDEYQRGKVSWRGWTEEKSILQKLARRERLHAVCACHSPPILLQKRNRRLNPRLDLNPCPSSPQSVNA